MSLVNVWLRKLTDVRNIEEARRRAHGLVLVHDAGVLHRHLPAAEFNELAAQLLMRGE
jgi:hypothetical protein